MDIGDDIIEQVKKGNQAAFRSLVETCQQYAFSLAFRIICDEEEARDAVQESFIKIWEKIKSYDGRSKFSTWMYRIVTNTAIDRLRAIKRLNRVALDAAGDFLEDRCQPGPAVQLDNKDIGEIIRFLSAGLPYKQHIVFVLRDIQGMDSEEVQHVMGLSENAVKSNLFHARKSIREKLDRLISFERRTS